MTMDGRLFRMKSEALRLSDKQSAYAAEAAADGNVELALSILSNARVLIEIVSVLAARIDRPGLINVESSDVG